MSARIAFLLAAAGSVALAPVLAGQETAPRGKAVYDKWCAGCHGDTGDGMGEAADYMLPRPRDFTRALYQIRTTASGELPTDRDIRRMVDDGMPGTAMPGWKTRLSEQERDDVVAYLKTFSRFFEGGAAPAMVDFGKAPSGSAEGLAEGEATYRKLECFKCHGDAGRGDGTSAPTMTDDWDQPIRPADLTENWHFNGGGSVEEIYRRLRTGLDGTPMPSYSDALASNIVTDEQLWRVAQYVRSLSPERTPQVREVIRAERVEAALPAGPGDSAWVAVERFYVPLVGQIIVKPRWFAPAVDGVWVQAVHDGERLAIRLSWSDPSVSPDPAWQEWLERLGQAMTDADGPPAAAQGPDRITVQFPLALPEGLERPYFLGGDVKLPVYQWRWTSMPDTVLEGTATGLGRFVALAGAPAVTHSARFDRGQWQVQLTRALAAPEGALGFVTGRAIPMAFSAAEGSSGEDEFRGSVSAWYAIYLDVPTPRRAFVLPIIATLLTAGAGVTIVVRAQRGRQAAPHQPEGHS